MKQLVKKFGFTLMEVNLAVFIMAAGVLAMVSLYPLGYRENQQSLDDVRSAAYADAVFNQVTGALSSRKLTWDEWMECVRGAVQQTNAGQKDGGWAKFCDRSKGYQVKKKAEINSISKQVFSRLTSKAGSVAGASATWPVTDSELATGLVAQWGVTRLETGNYQEDYSRVILSMRVARNAGSLFSQPIFLTEIHFQGDQLIEGNN